MFRERKSEREKCNEDNFLKQSECLTPSIKFFDFKNLNNQKHFDLGVVTCKFK